jgi:(2Fe-2S) ferredoxin
VTDAHLVLVGMSARDVHERDRLLALAATHGGSVAFLQLGDPTLSRELTRLADLGTERVVLVGVSLGTLAPANSWLRRIAGHWWRERSGHRPELRTAMGLLTDEADLPGLLRRLVEVAGTQAPLTSPAWDEVTPHRHQVLVCRGPRCSAAGSDATADALTLALMRAGLGDDDVLVVQTGCQLPCNHAPVVCVQPDDVWYGGVGPGEVERIVTDHLVADRPVAELRLPRSQRRTH